MHHKPSGCTPIPGVLPRGPESCTTQNRRLVAPATGRPVCERAPAAQASKLGKGGVAARWLCRRRQLMVAPRDDAGIVGPDRSETTCSAGVGGGTRRRAPGQWGKLQVALGARGKARRTEFPTPRTHTHPRTHRWGRQIQPNGPPFRENTWKLTTKPMSGEGSKTATLGGTSVQQVSAPPDETGVVGSKGWRHGAPAMCRKCH